MRPPNPGQVYSQSDEQRFRQAVQQADEQNRKKGQDIELNDGNRIIATSPDGTRWVMGVDDTGATTWTAL